MKPLFLPAALSLCLLPLAAEATDASKSAAVWPQWRGPLSNGVAPAGDPPVEWSETKNVKWKVELPGNGTSTPVIYGDKIFLTAALPAEGETGGPEDAKQPGSAPEPPREGGRRERGGRGRGGFGGGGGGGETPDKPYRFVLLCLERATGKILWERVATQEKPHEGHHRDHGYASHSPVTDGERVYAYFGSRGLHCFDMDGKPLWSKSLGRMRTRGTFGEGSSPLLVDDLIVVNWDHEGDDFVAAFDKKTGEEKWRKERDEPTSWSTPLAVEHEGKKQIVISATNRVRAYDPANGDVIWECGGMTANTIPTPVASADMVYAISGFRGSALRAIRLGRTGDLTDTDAVAWTYDSKTPYVPSPLLYEGRLYFFSGNTGVLTCLDAKTGKVLIDAERIPALSGVYASPVGVNGRVYLTGRNGEGVVLKASDSLEILATNKLDEKFDASPAVAGDELYLRGHKHLYCLSKDGK